MHLIGRCVGYSCRFLVWHVQTINCERWFLSKKIAHLIGRLQYPHQLVETMEKPNGFMWWCHVVSILRGNWLTFNIKPGLSRCTGLEGGVVGCWWLMTTNKKNGIIRIFNIDCHAYGICWPLFWPSMIFGMTLLQHVAFNGVLSSSTIIDLKPKKNHPQIKLI